MKRVKSRNEAILDLTAPLTEKYVYKVPSQREAWRPYHTFLESLFYLLIIKREFLEKIYLRGGRRTDPDLIYKLGQPHLRSSKLLACWNQLEGIQIETRNGSGSWLGGKW